MKSGSVMLVAGGFTTAGGEGRNWMSSETKGGFNSQHVLLGRQDGF